MQGHRAALALLPDRALGVAVLANFREALRADQLAVTALQTALLERDGVDVPPSRGDAELPPPAAVDPVTARAYSSRYAAESDVITLASAGEVMSSRSDHGETRLLPAPGGGFVSDEEPDVQVRLVERGGHRALTGTIRGFTSRVAVRCPDGHVPLIWRSRVGAYRVDAAPGEVFTFGTVHLELDGDSLQLRLDSTQSSPKAATITRYALAPVDDRIARIFGVGRGKGQQVLAEDGPDGPSLRWSGCRLVRAT